MEKKEAMKILKDFHDKSALFSVRTALDTIIPELHESEDEKIRKNCIHFLELQKSHHASTVEIDECIAWLEKQSEQKPTDMVEPKDYSSIDPHFFKTTDKVEPRFKVGDWCIDNEDGITFQIVKVLDNTYTYRTNEGKEYSCTHYSLENDARLWTIQDAKDGDVLASKDGKDILIFRRLDSSTSFSSYYSIKGSLHIGWSNRSFIPATKEQRDTLLKAMADAEYTFDFEKKELRKIEQKSAKFREGDNIQFKGVGHNRYTIREVCGLSHYINTNGKRMDMSYTDANFEVIKDSDKVKLSPAWGEEDEYNLAFIQEALLGLDGDDSYREKCCKMADWLESLKDKFVDFDKGFNVGFSAAKHNQWKPSEEQIKVCKEVYADILSAKGFDLGTVNSELNRMEEQLKNLKG